MFSVKLENDNDLFSFAYIMEHVIVPANRRERMYRHGCSLMTDPVV
jgi:hypothetical protein